jgi:hypothetical protein
MSEPIDLALGVLDHQLLDADERRCGKVDDLELDLAEGGAPRVTELLAGPTAWRSRGRVGRIAARLARGQARHVPWGEVVKVDSGVRLRGRASEYGLGRGDDRMRRWVEWIPGSHR